MKCPFCRYTESKVTDSRYAQDSIRRRRECGKCHKRYTTYETVDLTAQVIKRNGKFEDFSINKLKKGVEAACRHTRIGHEQVLKVISEVSSQIVHEGLEEISSQKIGEMVMSRLKKIDPVAYVRFACVYKRFKDIEEVIGALQEGTKQGSEYGVKQKTD